MNIIEEVQQSLGFSDIKKIDPNTQETKGIDTPMGNNALAQAGIPAILLGIYNQLENDPHSVLLDNVQSGSLLESVFGKATDEVVLKLSEYSKMKDTHNRQELEHIATESLRVVKSKITDPADENTVRKFVAANKPDCLLYLPPSLEMGVLLLNNNLDDRTGKMEGPVSSLMQKVEKIFNTTVGS